MTKMNTKNALKRLADTQGISETELLKRVYRQVNGKQREMARLLGVAPSSISTAIVRNRLEHALVESGELSHHKGGDPV